MAWVYLTSMWRSGAEVIVKLFKESKVALTNHRYPKKAWRVRKRKKNKKRKRRKKERKTKTGSTRAKKVVEDKKGVYQWHPARPNVFPTVS